MLGDAVSRISKSLAIGVVVASIGCLALGALAWFEIERERRIDRDDLDRRAHAVAYQLSHQVRDALDRPDSTMDGAMGTALEGHRRLLGFAVYRKSGNLAAAGSGVVEYTGLLDEPVREALSQQRETTRALRNGEKSLHVLTTPIHDDTGAVRGVLATVHDMTHLDDRTVGRRMQLVFWILIVAPIIAGLIVGAVRAAYERPLRKLADWMRRLRVYDAGDSPPTGIPVELLSNETNRLAASYRAARAARRAESGALARAERLWTRERLRDHAVDCLRSRQLVVVSNREPYMHQLRDGRPHMIVPAGGLVTALDPILQACGGVWVAHGSGEADRETVDAHSHVAVPPDDPRYTLRRVWLSREEEQGYYYGFANEGIWPLCHLAHERPVFRSGDWRHYVQANRRFADSVLEEVSGDNAVVLVQDYQLALVPQMLKAARPGLCVGIFWHIPWPNPEAFRICPWATSLLHGILAADLVGFHLQQYCNNFLDSADRMVEARLDWDHFAVELKGHSALIRPYPISIEAWKDRSVPAGDELREQIDKLKGRHALGGVQIAVGVDRIDYTKGLPERLRAIERFLEKYPKHRGRFVFVQLAAPSRTHLPRYRQLVADLEALADEINWRFQTDQWKPIRMLVSHHAAPAVHAFLRMADLCVVSSLHDGMNLVAKEYVSAREEGDGVLILSEFAGAARELPDALIVNPYDTEQFADAIFYGAEMHEQERRERMQRMRASVEENNVYRWAGNLLADLTVARARQPQRRRDVDHALDELRIQEPDPGRIKVP